jgi:hypothetical protein
MQLSIELLAAAALPRILFMSKAIFALILNHDLAVRSNELGLVNCTRSSDMECCDIHNKFPNFCFCCGEQHRSRPEHVNVSLTCQPGFAALITKPLADSHARSRFDFSSRSVEVISG